MHSKFNHSTSYSIMAQDAGPGLLRPMNNYTKDKSWPRRRIVGGAAEIMQDIAAQFSPIVHETSIAYRNDRSAACGLQPGNLGWHPIITSSGSLSTGHGLR